MPEPLSQNSAGGNDRDSDGSFDPIRDQLLTRASIDIERLGKDILDRAFPDVPEVIRRAIEEAVIDLDGAISEFQENVTVATERFAARVRQEISNPQQVLADVTSELSATHLSSMSLEDLLGQMLNVSDIVQVASNASFVAPATPFSGIRSHFYGPNEESFVNGVPSERQCLKSWFRSPKGGPTNQEMELFDAFLEANYESDVRRVGGTTIVDPDQLFSDLDENREVAKLLTGKKLAVIPVLPSGELFGHIIVVLQRVDKPNGNGQTGTDQNRGETGLGVSSQREGPIETERERESNALALTKARCEHIRNATQSALERALRVPNN